MDARPGFIGHDVIAHRAADAPPSITSISRDLGFRAPLERLLASIARAARSRAASLRIHDESSGELRLVASVDLPEQLERHVIHIKRDCGVCGDALYSDATRCASASCTCARSLEMDSGSGEERVFVMPLHHLGAPCGVLTLFFSRACEVPSAIAAMLPAIGDTLGLALENARLAQQTLAHSLVEERQMLAGEVHDALAQNLTFMRMRTALLREEIRQGQGKRALDYLDEIDESLADAHGRVRELINNCRIAMDPNGLLHALNRAVATVDGLGGLHIDYQHRVHSLSLSADQELQVLHIVREALANIVKHAQATSGRVLFEQREGEYVVTVEDDGVGVPGIQDGDGAPGHYGVNIMRERARRLGGGIEFGSHAGAGTWMRLRFPDPGYLVKVAS